jgi:hypothetical protein
MGPAIFCSTWNTHERKARLNLNSPQHSARRDSLRRHAENQDLLTS